MGHCLGVLLLPTKSAAFEEATTVVAATRENGGARKFGLRLPKNSDKLHSSSLYFCQVQFIHFKMSLPCYLQKSKYLPTNPDTACFFYSYKTYSKHTTSSFCINIYIVNYILSLCSYFYKFSLFYVQNINIMTLFVPSLLLYLCFT